MTSPATPRPPPAATCGRPIPPLPRRSSTCEGSSRAFGRKRMWEVTLTRSRRLRAAAECGSLGVGNLTRPPGCSIPGDEHGLGLRRDRPVVEDDALREPDARSPNRRDLALDDHLAHA